MDRGDTTAGGDVVDEQQHCGSPRSVGSIRCSSVQRDLTDTRIKLILLSSLVTDPDELHKLLKDVSCHRSSIVRSERLPVYVVLEKGFVQQFQCDGTNIERMSVDIIFHDCQAPAAIGRYYPSNTPSSSDELTSSADQVLHSKSTRAVSLPEGSICFIVETTVGEGVYDEIQARLQLPQRSFVDEIPGLDMDDVNIFFRSTTPGGNFLRSLSRNEDGLHGIGGQRYSTTLKIEMVEPVQVGWDRPSLYSANFWSIRVRNRLRDRPIVIRRFNLLFDHVENSLICLNHDSGPISLHPDEIYCFVYSAANTEQHIPTASFLLESEEFCSPILYQVQLLVKERETPWLNLYLECPPEVQNHSTFNVAVTVTNIGPIASDLELYIDNPHTIDESALKPYLCLDRTVVIGTLSTGQSATASLHFLALREGVIGLSNVAVRSKVSGKKFVQERPLLLLITRGPVGT